MASLSQAYPLSRSNKRNVTQPLVRPIRAGPFGARGESAAASSGDLTLPSAIEAQTLLPALLTASLRTIVT
ncbi:unnamed protein product, partial [Brenthis ino]